MQPTPALGRSSGSPVTPTSVTTRNRDGAERESDQQRLQPVIAGEASNLPVSTVSW
jgi:hypothetical protein